VERVEVIVSEWSQQEPVSDDRGINREHVANGVRRLAAAAMIAGWPGARGLLARDAWNGFLRAADAPCRARPTTDMPGPPN
jgi:hypothetical protein